MEWAAYGIIKQRLMGRKLLIWGTGSNAYNLSKFVSKIAPIEFYISRDAAIQPTFLNKSVYDFSQITLDSKEHFVLILAEARYKEIRTTLSDLGFVEYVDYYDYFQKGTHLPIDVSVDNVTIGRFSFHPFSISRLRKNVVSIGRYCSINGSVLINYNHPTNMITTSSRIQTLYDNEYNELYIKQRNSYNKTGNLKVKIGNDVWVGANTFINTSKCTRIGDGAVIGTGAIVMEDIPPYAIAYGAPAKVHRYRFSPEQIEILLRLRWWDWDSETIKQNAEALIYPERFFEKFG